MKHFHGIDGLRAWMAWIVTFSHVFMLTAADARIPVLHSFDTVASHAVSVFVMISGFVITHLIVERKEPYGPYIVRRFLRIYPVYILCLGFGVLSTWLYVQAFTGAPWGEWAPQAQFFASQKAVMEGQDLSTHLLAHIFLVHGMIPDNVLLYSQFMILGPAWSLSLEWQFYLLAPLILYSLRYPWGRILIPILTVIAYWAYTGGKLGDFEEPSFLPGAGLFFAVGIATRLIIKKIPRPATYPLAAVIIAVAFVQMEHALAPFLVWGAFVAWMVVDRPADAVSRRIHKILGWAFDSKAARYLGERSYSTYLVHYPLTHIFTYAAIKLLKLGMWPTVAMELVLVPVFTLLLSSVLYAYVEAPAIAYGKRLYKEAK